MSWTPSLASIRDSLLTNPRMLRRVWARYPAILDGFAAEAQRVLDTDWEHKSWAERQLLAEVMDHARNPNLARLLRQEDFPVLRDSLLAELEIAAEPLPIDARLLKALGVWTLRRKQKLPGPRRVLDLARALRRNGQAGLARRLLLHRLWLKEDCPPELFFRVRDELALCTSMATDLAPGPRLDAARDLLHVPPPQADMARVSKKGDHSWAAPGLRYRGWVHRRRWEFHHHRHDLNLASRAYQRAAKLSEDPLDKLKNAADAAYHLDLMAKLDKELGSPDDARQNQARADALRLDYLDELFPDPAEAKAPPAIEDDPVQHYRWLHNVAQLQLGLQRWAESVEAERERGREPSPETARRLERFRQLPRPLRHLVQARKLARQVDERAAARVEASKDEDAAAAVSVPPPALPDWIQSRKVRELAERSKLWEVDDVYLMALVDKGKVDREAIGRSISMGKVGLGFSGGGFRASLFHLGVLASLAERDLLRRIEVISSVSGGSIVGAHFYLKLRRLLQSRDDQEIDRDDYVELVREVIHEFLTGVQKNIRTRVVASPWANLKMLLSHYTRSTRAGDLLGRHLFRRVTERPDEERRPKPWLLSDLRVEPFRRSETNGGGEAADAAGDDGGGFNPKLDNWRREHKVPILILNATSLNTGHSWQFGATWMGESPAAVDPDVDSNDRLRRMELGTEAPPPHHELELGHAVAASACVPGLFEPSALAGLYDRKLVRLVDGGVFDNQGIAGLLEQECSIILVSDASGQMASQDRPHGGFLGSTMRTNTILMDRVRQTQFRDLQARQRSGQLDGLSYVHLKQELEADAVNWLGCDDPKPGAPPGELPAYGIPRPTQELLAGIRTDLDSFCDAEAYALMYSGYRMMNAECRRLLRTHADLVQEVKRTGDPKASAGAAAEPPEAPAEIAADWPFFCVEERMTDDSAPGHGRLAGILDVGSRGAFKIWRLWRRGRPLAKWTAGGVAALPMAWLAWLYGSWLAGIDPRQTLGVSQLALGLLPVAALALLLVPPLRALLARVVRLAALGVLGMIAAWIHLLVFDPLYLRYGREPAGFARRLLHEARQHIARHELAQADRKTRKALAILHRLLRPATPGAAPPVDSPWLSRVAEARALALTGSPEEAAKRLAALATELAGAAEEMEEEAAVETTAARKRWLGERQDILRRRRAYVRHLAAELAGEATGA